MEHFLQTQAFQAFVAEAQRKSFTSSLFHVLACPPVPYSHGIDDVPSAAAGVVRTSAFPRETTIAGASWKKYESGALVELESVEQRMTMVLPGPCLEPAPRPPSLSLTGDGADSCLFPRFSDKAFVSSPQYQKMLQVLEHTIRAQPALPELYILRADVHSAVYVDAKKRLPKEKKTVLPPQLTQQAAMRRMLEAALLDYGIACDINSMLTNTAKLEECFTFVIEELQWLLAPNELERLVLSLTGAALEISTRLLDAQSEGHVRWSDFMRADSDTSSTPPPLSNQDASTHGADSTSTTTTTNNNTTTPTAPSTGPSQGATAGSSATSPGGATQQQPPAQPPAAAAKEPQAPAAPAQQPPVPRTRPPPRDHDKPLASSDISWLGITPAQAADHNPLFLARSAQPPTDQIDADTFMAVAERLNLCIEDPRSLTAYESLLSLRYAPTTLLRADRHRPCKTTLRAYDALASGITKPLQRRRLMKFLDTLKAMNLLRNEWEKKLELGPEEMVICASIVSTFQGTQGHLVLTTSRIIWRVCPCTHVWRVYTRHSLTDCDARM